MNNMTQAKPFIKWAGGKTQLLEEIRKRYPSHIEKYCEPFVGGGAVLFDILNKKAPSSILINDINKDLINLYFQVKNNCNLLIEHLTELHNLYKNQRLEENRKLFYEKRKRFNEIELDDSYRDDNGKNLEKASLFIFLNKTCYNGLYRVNSKGFFNVPYNNATNPLFFDKENLLACSALLQNVEMTACNYNSCKNFIDDKTFVYLDPPYRPISKTARFTSYSRNGFSDRDQLDLATFINELANKGAMILLSNSDPKNENTDDTFFDSLYSNFKICRVSATRMINSDATKRSATSELLISNI